MRCWASGHWERVGEAGRSVQSPGEAREPPGPLSPEPKLYKGRSCLSMRQLENPCPGSSRPSLPSLKPPLPLHSQTHTRVQSRGSWPEQPQQFSQPGPRLGDVGPPCEVRKETRPFSLTATGKSPHLLGPGLQVCKVDRGGEARVGRGRSRELPQRSSLPRRHLGRHTGGTSWPLVRGLLGASGPV